MISQNGGFFILKLAMAKKVALENLISKTKVLQIGNQTLKRCLPAKKWARIPIQKSCPFSTS